MLKYKIKYFLLAILIFSNLAWADSGDEKQTRKSLFSSFKIEEGMNVIAQASIKAPVLPVNACSRLDGWRNTSSGNANNSLCWQTSGWSSCSNGCGEGEINRTATCILPDGTVSDGCDENRKPVLTRPCTDTSDCNFQWRTGAWENCEPSCGESQKTRTLTCVDQNEVSVENIFCNRIVAPLTVETCEDFSACTYSWAYTDWSECSKTCGVGTKTRSAQCQRNDGSETVVDDSYCADEKIIESTCSETTSCANVTLKWAVDNHGNIYRSNSNGEKFDIIDSFDQFAYLKTTSMQYAEADENGYVWLYVELYNGGGPGGIHLQEGNSGSCFERVSSPNYIGAGRASTLWYNGPCWRRISDGTLSRNWLFRFKAN